VTNKILTSNILTNNFVTNNFITNKLITNKLKSDKIARFASRKVRRRASMLGVCAGVILAPACASAQDAQSDRLQRQLDALQSQVQSLQKQVAEQKKREALGAQAAAGTAYGADAKMPLKTKAPSPPKPRPSSCLQPAPPARSPTMVR
jgi:peptidoglycan hydrolase CwlO-like protein